MPKNIKRMIIPILILGLVGIGFWIYQADTDPHSPYDKWIFQYAKQYQLEPALVLAVIKTESNFDPEACSNKNAYGLMQITEPTLKWAMMREGKQAAYTVDDLYNPKINIKYGCYILSLLFEEFDDRQTVLAAYNAGRGNVKKWLKDTRYAENDVIIDTPFAETDHYISKVENYYQKYIERLGAST